MKKNLFYAAFAIAMMASCTNEDNLVVDPVDSTPDAEDKVALTLGIDAPSVNATVGARGTGSVGDVAGEDNVWNSQQLYITMIDRSTGLVAVDGNGEAIMDYDSYTYVAPRKSEQTTEATYGKGKIRVYETYEPSAPTVSGQETEDKGILQYLYYPVQGTFDFYGWHLDDAAESNPTVDVTANNITISGITIDGTQDIMGAKTKPFTSTTNYAGYTDALAEWAFSAKTARNEIDPILTFEHKLARVKFFVKAGSWSAALHNEDGSLKTANPNANDETATGAMYITGIKAQKMHSEFTMTLNESGITTSDATNPIEFELGDIDATTGLISTLVPKAPNYRKDYASVPTGETDYTQVGEAIMFLPVEGSTADSLTFHLDMKQYVQLQEDETDGVPETGNGDDWDFETREDVPVKVAAVNVKKADGSNATAFKAGESYNVYITIYGFEKIEVSAELTPWELGGDVDVDIEDGVSNSGSQTPVTPTTVELTFNVTDGTSAIENPTILVWEGTEAYTENTSVKVEPY